MSSLHKIGSLSRDALLHAQELDTRDPQALAMALYRYNHIPNSPRWQTRFATSAAVLACVHADSGPLRRTLDRNWRQSEYEDLWLAWRPKSAQQAGESYKLYVSPHPARIRDAFQALVRVLALRPVAIKMGCSTAGLLRPDKIAAYFATREELEDAASRLRSELAGCEGQGVPFTAALDDSGLLSWGVDPPRISGRLWVTQHLGNAMSVAKSAQFALTEIQRHGVDPRTWTVT